MAFRGSSIWWGSGRPSLIGGPARCPLLSREHRRAESCRRPCREADRRGRRLQQFLPASQALDPRSVDLRSAWHVPTSLWQRIARHSRKIAPYHPRPRRAPRYSPRAECGEDSSAHTFSPKSPRSILGFSSDAVQARRIHVGQPRGRCRSQLTRGLTTHGD
jgi:hypothetical protein